MINKIAFLLITLVLFSANVFATHPEVFPGESYTGYRNENIDLNGYATNDDGTITNIAWAVPSDCSIVDEFIYVQGDQNIDNAVISCTDILSDNVSLTADNNYGESTTGDATLEISNQAPIAVLDVSPDSGEPPLVVTLSGFCEDQDGNGTINTCFLDYGDGNGEAIASPYNFSKSHTYYTVGQYPAKLMVNDDQDANAQQCPSCTDSEVISVATNQAPLASNVQITPSSPATSNDLTCEYEYDDNENDSEGTTTFLWYKDEVPQTSETSQTLDSSETSEGDDWICQVTPVASTGTSPGEDVNSDEITIGAIGKPTIESSTHDEDEWEDNDDPEFSWSSVSGATYYYVFNSSSGTVPDTDDDSKTGTSMSYSNQSNGTHYFHVRARVEGEWSTTDHYKIKIDDENPDKPTGLNATYDEDDEDIDLSWDESDDDYSGIDYYEVYRGTNSDFDDMERQATNTDRSYSEDDLVEGKRYYYRVRAKDEAGNYSTESDYVTVVFGEGEQRPKPTVEWTEPDDDDVVSEVVELEAKAIADSSTSIKRVRFYADDSYLGDGTRSGSYYTFDWNTLAEDDGDYELKAISLDWYGISSNPDKIDVTVDNVPETDGMRADAQAAIDAADDAKEAAASLFADFEAVGASPSDDAMELLAEGSHLLEEGQEEFDEGNYDSAKAKAAEAKEKFDELLETLSIEGYGEGQEYVYNEEHLELLLKGLGFSQGLVDEVKETVEDYTVGRSLSVKAVKEKYSTSYRAVITVTMKNDSGEAKQVKVIEVIPKELAESASLISGEGFEVVVDDPVLQWQLELEAGEEAEIVYFLKDDLTEGQADELLESAVLSKFAVPPVLVKPDTEIATESFSAGAALFGLGTAIEAVGWIVLAVIIVAAALLAFNYLRGMEREGSGLGSGMPRTGSVGFLGRLRPGKKEEKSKGPKWQYRG